MAKSELANLRTQLRKLAQAHDDLRITHRVSMLTSNLRILEKDPNDKPARAALAKNLEGLAKVLRSRS